MSKKKQPEVREAVIDSNGDIDYTGINAENCGYAGYLDNVTLTPIPAYNETMHKLSDPENRTNKTRLSLDWGLAYRRLSAEEFAKYDALYRGLDEAEYKQQIEADLRITADRTQASLLNMSLDEYLAGIHAGTITRPGEMSDLQKEASEL